MRAELKVDPEQRLLVRRSLHDHEVARRAAANPLRLIPSVYVWPHVRVNCDAPWPLAVLYPPATMRSGARRHARRPTRSSRRCAPPPTRPASASSSSSASSRGRPRSSRRSSALSESGLSKHLRALTDAGLLTTKREGWYVLYHLDRERLAGARATSL